MRFFGRHKLEGTENFIRWMRELKGCLEVFGLYKHVGNDSPPPEDPGDVKVGDIQELLRFLRWADWQQNENKARFMIRTSVSAGIVVNSSKTAHDMLNDLVERFGKAPVNKYMLYQCWSGLQWDGKKFDHFWIRWQDALADCLDVGIPISEEVKVCTFVNMVKNCGNPIYENWASEKMRDGELPQLDDVYWELDRFCTSNDVYRTLCEEQKSKCGVCGVKRHTPSECWHLHPDLGPRRFRPKKWLVSAYKERMEIDSDEHETETEEKEEYDSRDDEEISRQREFLTMLLR